MRSAASCITYHVYMYVCIVTHIARVCINRIICQSCSWSAEQGKLIFPCPRSRLRIWSRETGLAVPSRVSLLISILRLNLVLTYGIPRVPRRRPFLYSFKPPHAIGGQPRICRVTQSRTDGAHCGESAGTGPVNLKVPNGCCLGRSPWTN